MNGGERAQVVLLVRHGEALGKDENPKRPLSDAGRRHVEKVSGLLAGGMVTEVRHSGKARARQTAEILAAEIGVPLDRVREIPGIRPDDDVHPVAEALEREGASVALVGHMPFMAKLASRLLAGSSERVAVGFGDAACMVLSRNGRTWRLDGLLNHHLLR